MMHTQQLTSSVLCEASYDDESKTLHITFTRNGRVDTIKHFPKKMFDELCATKFVGDYYNNNIRGVKFEENTDGEQVVEKDNRAGDTKTE